MVIEQSHEPQAEVSRRSAAPRDQSDESAELEVIDVIVRQIVSGAHMPWPFRKLCGEHGICRDGGILIGQLGATDERARRALCARGAPLARRS